jgi:hypothetical protein
VAAASFAVAVAASLMEEVAAAAFGTALAAFASFVEVEAPVASIDALEEEEAGVVAVAP